MKRLLSLILVLVMTLSLLPLGALATEEEPVEEAPAPEVTATLAPEVTATPAPEVTATPEPEVTATPEPEVTATPAPEVTEAPEPSEPSTDEGEDEGEDENQNEIITAKALTVGTAVTATAGEVYTVTLGNEAVYYLSADPTVQVTITPSTDGDEGQAQPEGSEQDGEGASNPPPASAETVYGGGWYMLRAASEKECTVTVVTGGTFTLMNAANANLTELEVDTDITPNLAAGRRVLYSFTAEWDDVYYYWLSDTSKMAGSIAFYSETGMSDLYFSIKLKAGEKVWIGVENDYPSGETTDGSFQIKSEKTLKEYTVSGTETITSQEKFFKVTFPETGWYPAQLTGSSGQIMLAGYGRIYQLDSAFKEYYTEVGGCFVIRKPCSIIFMTDVGTTVRKATDDDFITGTLGVTNTTGGTYRYAVTETASYKLSAVIRAPGGGIEVYSEDGTWLAGVGVERPTDGAVAALESKETEFPATAGDTLYISYSGAEGTSFTLTKNAEMEENPTPTATPEPSTGGDEGGSASAIEFGREYTAPEYTDPYTITLENGKLYYVEISSGLDLFIRSPDTAWGCDFTQSGVFKCSSSGGAEVSCEICAMNSTSGTFTLYELADVVPEGNVLQEGVNTLTVDDDGAFYSLTSENGGTYLVLAPEGCSVSCYRETEELWWWSRIQMEAGETVVFHITSTPSDAGTTKTMTVMERNNVPKLSQDAATAASDGQLFAIPDLQQGWYKVSTPNGTAEIVTFSMGDTGDYCLKDYFYSDGFPNGGLYFYYTGQDGTISLCETDDSDFVSVTLPEDLNKEITPGDKLIRITAKDDVTYIASGSLYSSEWENNAKDRVQLLTFAAGGEYVYASDNCVKLQTTAQYGATVIALDVQTEIEYGKYYTFTPEKTDYYSLEIASAGDSEAEETNGASGEMRAMLMLAPLEWIDNGEIRYFVAGREYIIYMRNDSQSVGLTIAKADIEGLPAIEFGKEYTDDDPLATGDYRFTPEAAGDYLVTVTGNVRAEPVTELERGTDLPSVLQLQAEQSVYIKVDWRTEGDGKSSEAVENKLKIVDLTQSTEAIALSLDSETLLTAGRHLYRFTATEDGTYTFHPEKKTDEFCMAYFYEHGTGWKLIYRETNWDSTANDYTVELKSGESVYLYGETSEREDGAIALCVKCDSKTNVSEQLGSISNEASPEEIREAVQAIDTEALTEALTGEQAEDVLETLEALEKTVKQSAEITVKTTSTVDSVQEISVAGAALNALSEESGGNVKLTVQPAEPSETAALPENVSEEDAVYLDIQLEGVETPHELAVPVVLTIAVPEDMDPSLLRIVHYKENEAGEVVGTEILKPTVFRNEDGKYYARFVATGFSTFVLTQLLRLLGDFNEDGEVTILDVLALLKFVAGIADELPYGDVNGDGAVTILDVLHLLKFVAGIIPEL